MDTRDIAADVLNVPFDGKWDIFHQDESLCLVHYISKNGELPLHKNLRSVVIDKGYGTIVAKSLNFVPKIVLDELPNSAIWTCKDNYGQSHVFNQSDISIFTCYEGVILRAMRHEGRNYILQAKSLTGQDGEWKPGKKFGTYWTEAGLPAIEEMYDQNFPYSPWVYEFLIVHPDLFTSSKIIVDKPFFILNNKYRAYSESTCPYPRSRVKFECMVDIPLGLQKINIERANRILKHGHCDNTYYYDNPKLDQGESVLLACNDSIYHVVSKAYNWRFTFRNGAKELKDLLYVLSNDLFKAEKSKSFKSYVEGEYSSKFIYYKPLPKKHISNLVSNDQIISLPLANEREKEEIKSKFQSLFYNIWLNIIVSAPISQQKEAYDTLAKYHDDCRKLEDKLYTAHVQNEVFQYVRFVAIKDAIKTLMEKKRNPKFSHEQNLRHFIHKIVSNESPLSIKMLNTRYEIDKYGAPVNTLSNSLKAIF